MSTQDTLKGARFASPRRCPFRSSALSRTLVRGGALFGQIPAHPERGAVDVGPFGGLPEEPPGAVIRHVANAGLDGRFDLGALVPFVVARDRDHVCAGADRAPPHPVVVGEGLCKLDLSPISPWNKLANVRKSCGPRRRHDVNFDFYDWTDRFWLEVSV